jgi:hypothetical protein
MEFEYDVTLSFAGEDRDYVKKVAQVLSENGVKVFYDEFEEVDLWGKDLGIHFDFVYRKSARYCIPFISKHYKAKVWTNYEIRTAIARAIQSNEEYILPSRFDDTEIEGIRPTLGFIELTKYSPEQFASLIIKKLKKEQVTPVTELAQKDEGKVYLSVNMLFSEFQGLFGLAIGVQITNVIKEHRYFNEPFFRLTKPFENKSDSLYFFEKVQEVRFPNKLEYGAVVSVNYNIKPLSLDKIWSKLPPDTEIYAIVTTTVGEKYTSNKVKVEEVVKGLSEIVNKQR